MVSAAAYGARHDPDTFARAPQEALVAGANVSGSCLAPYTVR